MNTRTLITILLVLPFLLGATPFESPTERGTQAYTAGKFDDALENYQKAAQDNPDKAEAHYNLGGAYYKKGEYDRALKEYDEAEKLDPKMADAYYNSGDALYRMGMYGKALDAYKKADSLKKGDADTQHNINVVIKKVQQEKEKQKQQQKPPQGKQKQGQGKDEKGKGGGKDKENDGQGSAGQGQQGGQDKGPSMSNEEIQAMMERQKKEEKQLRNYFRPGQKEQKDDREAQIEQILRAAGMQVPARAARPGAPYIEKDW